MTLITKLQTKAAALGLTAALLHCGPKEEVHHNYTIYMGKDDAGNYDYSCEGWATSTAKCFPSEGPNYRKELITTCQEFDLSNTTEGQAFMKCTYDNQCDYAKMNACEKLVPGLD